jgi:hypothetical protein
MQLLCDCGVITGEVERDRAAVQDEEGIECPGEPDLASGRRFSDYRTCRWLRM